MTRGEHLLHLMRDFCANDSVPARWTVKIIVLYSMIQDGRIISIASIGMLKLEQVSAGPSSELPNMITEYRIQVRHPLK